MPENNSTGKFTPIEEAASKQPSGVFDLSSSGTTDGLYEKLGIDKEQHQRFRKEVLGKANPGAQLGLNPELKKPKPGAIERSLMEDYSASVANAFLNDFGRGIANLIPTVSNMITQTDFADKWIEYSNQWWEDRRFTTSDAGNQSFMDDWTNANAWATAIGQGIGFLGGIMATAGIGGAALKGVTAAGKLGTALRTASLAGRGARMGQVGQHIGGFLGGMSAQSAMLYNEYKEAGVNSTDAARLAIATASIVSLSEGMALAWIGKGIARPLTSKLAKTEIANSIKELAKKGKFGAKGLTKETKLSPKQFEEVAKLTGLSLIEKSKAIGVKALEGAAIEFGQEFTQQYIEETSKYLYDNVFSDAGKDYFKHDFLGEGFKKALGGGIIGAIVGGTMAGGGSLVRGLKGETVFGVVDDAVRNNKPKKLKELNLMVKELIAKKELADDPKALYEHIESIKRFSESTKGLHLDSGTSRYQMFQMMHLQDNLNKKSAEKYKVTEQTHPLVKDSYRQDLEKTGMITDALNMDMQALLTFGEIAGDAVLSKNRGKFESRLDEYKKLYRDVTYNKITKEELKVKLDEMSGKIKTAEGTDAKTKVDDNVADDRPSHIQVAEKLGAFTESKEIEGAVNVRIGATNMILNTNKDGNVVLESIETDNSQRERGSAKQALDKLNEATDELGFTTELDVLPKDETIDQERLVKLYEGKGFKINKNKAVKKATNKVDDTSSITDIVATETKVTEILQGSGYQLDLDPNQPGSIVNGTFIPENIGEQMYKYIASRLWGAGKGKAKNSVEAKKKFKEYAKEVHPDKHQDEDAKALAETYFKAMQRAKDMANFQALDELKKEFDKDLATLQEKKTQAQAKSQSQAQSAPEPKVVTLEPISMIRIPSEKATKKDDSKSTKPKPGSRTVTIKKDDDGKAAVVTDDKSKDDSTTPSQDKDMGKGEAFGEQTGEEINIPEKKVRLDKKNQKLRDELQKIFAETFPWIKVDWTNDPIMDDEAAHNQISETFENEATEELDVRMKDLLVDFMKGLNIEVLEGEKADEAIARQFGTEKVVDGKTVYEYNGNILSAFDLLQKFMALGSDMTNQDIRRQAANVIYTFLGRKSDASILIWKSIHKWSGYQESYNKWRAIEQESYTEDQIKKRNELNDFEEMLGGEEITFFEEERPGSYSRWARNQAVIDFFADMIDFVDKNGYTGKKFKVEDISKEYFESRGFRNIYVEGKFARIRGIFNELFNRLVKLLRLRPDPLKELSEQELTDRAMDIVDDVFKKNYEKFMRAHRVNADGVIVDAKGNEFEQKFYEKTLEKDPFARDIIDKLMGNPFLAYQLSGSQTVRKYGSLFRAATEDLHDIDGVIPYETFKKDPMAIQVMNWIKTRGLELTFGDKRLMSLIKGNRERFNKEFLPLMEKMNWYANIKNTFPGFKLTNAFIGKDHRQGESITVTGYVENPNEIEMDSSKENYLKPKQYILDFFIRTKSEGNFPLVLDNYWRDWKAIYEAKIKMGRSKDMADLVFYRPFMEDKYKFTNKGFRFFTMKPVNTGNPQVFNQRSNLDWFQQEAKNIYFDEVWNKRLTPGKVQEINNKLRKLSDTAGDVEWYLRKSKKGNYYVAGYNNGVVTMDTYYSPYAEGRYRQMNKGVILGQANIDAKTILIDALNQRNDTLPHEYAHHYIAAFRDTEIVQEGIRRFGSEEKLVQAIGEQATHQRGKAYNWWKKFTKFILDLLSDKQVLQVLTDNFINNINLRDAYTYEYTNAQKKAGKKTGSTLKAKIQSSIAAVIENSSRVRPAKEDGTLLTEEELEEGVEYKKYVDLSDPNNPQVLDRVSDWVSDDEYSDNERVRSAQAIGKKNDAVYRLVMDGTITSSTEETQIADPNNEGAFVSLADWVGGKAAYKSLVEGALAVKAEIEAKGETIVLDPNGNEITIASKRYGFAGTVDLLTVDEEGVFRVYDFKTMADNNFRTKVTYLEDGKLKEVSKYDFKGYYDSEARRYVGDRNKFSKREKHQRQVSLYRIALAESNNVIASEEVGIIPIQLSYSPGETKSRVYRRLPTVVMTALDKVVAEHKGTTAKFIPYQENNTVKDATGDVVAVPNDNAVSEDIVQSTGNEDKIKAINQKRRVKSDRNVRPRGKEQRSRNDRRHTAKISEDQALFRKIADYFHKAFPSVPVEYVEKIIEGNGYAVLGELSKRGIRINSNQATQTTLIHEYAHVFFDLVSPENPLIKQGMELIKESDFFREAQALYWDETPEQQAKEALIEAVSENALEKLRVKFEGTAFEKFVAWAKRFWNKIKLIFKNRSQKTVIDALANQLIKAKSSTVNLSHLKSDVLYQKKYSEERIRLAEQVQESILYLRTSAIVDPSLQIDLSNINEYIFSVWLDLANKYLEDTKPGSKNKIFVDKLDIDLNQFKKLMNGTAQEERAAMNMLAREYKKVNPEEFEFIQRATLNISKLTPTVEELETSEENPLGENKTNSDVINRRQFSPSIRSIISSLIDNDGNLIHPDSVWRTVGAISNASINGEEFINNLVSLEKSGDLVAARLNQSMLIVPEEWERSIVTELNSANQKKFKKVLYEMRNGKPRIFVRALNQDEIGKSEIAEMKRRIYNLEGKDNTKFWKGILEEPLWKLLKSQNIDGEWISTQWATNMNQRGEHTMMYLPGIISRLTGETFTEEETKEFLKKVKGDVTAFLSMASQIMGGYKKITDKKNIDGYLKAIKEVKDDTERLENSFLNSNADSITSTAFTYWIDTFITQARHNKLFRDMLMSSDIYKNNPVLKNILSHNGLAYSNFDAIDNQLIKEVVPHAKQSNDDLMLTTLAMFMNGSNTEVYDQWYGIQGDRDNIQFVQAPRYKGSELKQNYQILADIERQAIINEYGNGIWNKKNKLDKIRDKFNKMSPNYMDESGAIYTPWSEGYAKMDKIKKNIQDYKDLIVGNNLEEAFTYDHVGEEKLYPNLTKALESFVLTEALNRQFVQHLFQGVNVHRKNVSDQMKRSVSTNTGGTWIDIDKPVVTVVMDYGEASNSFSFNGVGLHKRIIDMLGGLRPDAINSKDLLYQVDPITGQMNFQKMSSFGVAGDVGSNNLYQFNEFYGKLADALIKIEESLGGRAYVKLVDKEVLKGNKGKKGDQSWEDIAISFEDLIKDDIDVDSIIKNNSFEDNFINYRVLFDINKDYNAKTVEEQKSILSTQFSTLVLNTGNVEDIDKFQSLLVRLSMKQLGLTGENDELSDSELVKILNNPDALLQKLLKGENGNKGFLNDLITGLRDYIKDEKIDYLDHPNLTSIIEQYISSKISDVGIRLELPGGQFQMTPDYGETLEGSKVVKIDGKERFIESEIAVPWSLFASTREEAEKLLAEKNEKGGLRVLGVRVPASHPVSAFAAKVKYFTEGHTNSVITPTQYLDRSDADHDGDKLFIYREDLITLEDDSVVVNKSTENDIFKMMYGLMHSRKITEAQNNNLDLKPILDLVDELGVNKEELFDTSFIAETSDLATSISFAQEAIGIFALSSKLSNMLSQLGVSFKNPIEFFGEEKKDFSDEALINLSRYLQAALDMLKNPVLLSTGITNRTINVASLLNMLNFSQENIMKFLTSPYIAEFEELSKKLSNSYGNETWIPEKELYERYKAEKIGYEVSTDIQTKQDYENVEAIGMIISEEKASKLLGKVFKVKYSRDTYFSWEQKSKTITGGKTSVKLMPKKVVLNETLTQEQNEALYTISKFEELQKLANTEVKSLISLVGLDRKLPNNSEQLRMLIEAIDRLKTRQTEDIEAGFVEGAEENSMTGKSDSWRIITRPHTAHGIKLAELMNDIYSNQLFTSSPKYLKLVDGIMEKLAKSSNPQVVNKKVKNAIYHYISQMSMNDNNVNADKLIKQFSKEIKRLHIMSRSTSEQLEKTFPSKVQDLLELKRNNFEAYQELISQNEAAFARDIKFIENYERTLDYSEKLKGNKFIDNIQFRDVTETLPNGQEVSYTIMSLKPEFKDSSPLYKQEAIEDFDNLPSEIREKFKDYQMYRWGVMDKIGSMISMMPQSVTNEYFKNLTKFAKEMNTSERYEIIENNVLNTLKDNVRKLGMTQEGKITSQYEGLYKIGDNLVYYTPPIKSKEEYESRDVKIQLIENGEFQMSDKFVKFDRNISVREISQEEAAELKKKCS